MAVPKMRILKDHELTTPEQIRFRISQLEKEVLSTTEHARLVALKKRLPADTSKALPAASDPSLLISKRDLD